MLRSITVVVACLVGNAAGVAPCPPPDPTSPGKTEPPRFRLKGHKEEKNPCPTGSFSYPSAENSTNCTCSAGFFSSDGYATNDSCIECPSGKVSSSAGSIDCQSCPIGQVDLFRQSCTKTGWTGVQNQHCFWARSASAHPTLAEAQAECVALGATCAGVWGYDAEKNAGYCGANEPWYTCIVYPYRPEVGLGHSRGECMVMKAPTVCKAGSAGPLNATRATQCTTCAAGTFAIAGSTACTPCTKGQFSQAGAARCTACPAFTFADAEGAATCATCPAGKVPGRVPLNAEDDQISTGPVGNSAATHLGSNSCLPPPPLEEIAFMQELARAAPLCFNDLSTAQLSRGLCGWQLKANTRIICTQEGLCHNDPKGWLVRTGIDCVSAIQSGDECAADMANRLNWFGVPHDGATLLGQICPGSCPEYCANRTRTTRLKLVELAECGINDLPESIASATELGRCE